MSLHEALCIISEHYNIESNYLEDLLEKHKNSIGDTKIILPYYGVIFEDRCKGLLFNHGLYTQCHEKKATGFCKNCEKQKYGSIYDRQKYEVGKFISKTGKPELHYGKFIKKMNYNINDVKRYFDKNNIEHMDYFNEITTKSRGRPRKEKLDNDTEDTLEVVEVTIENKKYYKSKEGVLLDINSYEIIGILINNKIEKIE